MKYNTATDLQNITYMLSKEIHAECVEAGWWSSYKNKLDRQDTAYMLVATELAEACEGDRKSLMDDHLPHYKSLHVELADAAIRLLDTFGAYGARFSLIDWNDVHEAADRISMKSIPEQLFECVKAIANDKPEHCLVLIFAIAQLERIYLPAIIEEKRTYNRHRQDHKKEVRANDLHGKKY